MPDQSATDKPVVIFDGTCNFCNGAVNFIIKHDPEQRFLFAPSQGLAGQAVLEKHSLMREAGETLVYIHGNTVITKSDAALTILRNLKTGWKFLLITRLIPRPIRDWCYSHFSRNRYRLFGKLDNCIRPSPKLRDRFLE